MLSVTISSNSSAVVCDAGLADRARAAGDIDQNIDAPAERCLRGVCRGVARGWLGQVARHDDRLAAFRLDLGRDRLDRRGVAPDQRQPTAFLRERLADRGAHPLRRSGDHRDAAFQSEVHENFPAVCAALSSPSPACGGGLGRGRAHSPSGSLRSPPPPQAEEGKASQFVFTSISLFGRSAFGGRNVGVKISLTAGVRGSWLASTRMSIELLHARIVDVAQSDRRDLGMVHLLLHGRDRSAPSRPAS